MNKNNRCCLIKNDKRKKKELKSKQNRRNCAILMYWLSK